MKFHEPKVITLINAVVVTMVYIILMFIALFLFTPSLFSDFHKILFLILSGAGLFGITFSLLRFTIDRFLYSKIRLIYKTIHQIKAPKNNGMVGRGSENLLDQATREVAAWQHEKSQEIEQLKQLETYRREFIGNVSHELKTPLFNIQGYVMTLLDGAIDDTEINREYLKRTEKSIDRLIRIVEDLDEISQLESGQLKLTIVRFDIVALTREVIDLLEMKSKKKGISVYCSKQEKPIYVEGDPEKIRQVLSNLIDNSIRYGKEQGGKTKVSFFDMDENILTEITDNGIGISPVDLPRVFERFYRTRKGRALSNKGKGLGLAIVKHIIEAHGQTVNVRSTIGIGTTFGFTLKKRV